MNEEKQNSNELKERAENKLDYFVEKCEMYIDTCSLLHFASMDFFDNVEAMLSKYSKQIYVLSGGVKELEKHSLNSEDVGLASNAKKTLRIIKMYIENNLISIVENDDFVDNAFLTLFTNLRMNHYPLLITQDKNLANDILNLNNTLSVKANKVRVAKINQYGFLSEFLNTEEHKNQKQEEYVATKEFYYTDENLLRTSHWEIDANLKSATEDEFDCYCRDFLIEKIYEVIPKESLLNYGHVYKLIYCIDPILFQNLKQKSMRILLVTQILGLFKSVKVSIHKEIVHVIVESLVKKRYGAINEISILECADIQKNVEFDLEGMRSDELDWDTFDMYCRFYYIEKVYDALSDDSSLNYGHVYKLIFSIDPSLIENVHTEMGRLTLANKIHSMFRAVSEENISKEYLINIAKNL